LPSANVGEENKLAETRVFNKFAAYYSQNGKQFWLV
jgi:hypothetical protein